MSNLRPVVRPNVRFEIQSVLLESETREKGTPVYREAEFVVFRMPGDKHTEVWKEVTPHEIIDWKRTEHKDHVPAMYDAWKNGLDAPVNGTALKDWPSISPAQVHQALALGIRTVEDFANLSEDGIRNFGFGARELQRKASAYLSYGTDQGKVIEQVAAQQTQIENQTTLMQQMQAQFAELQAELQAERAAKNALLAKGKKAEAA